MKRLLFLIPFAVSACASPAPIRYAPSSSYLNFHSWYRGENVHSVWGLGEVSASKDEGHVLCGVERISVMPIFDAQSAAGIEPPAGRTQADAAEHNEMVLSRFAKSGVTCRLPSGDARTPN